MSTMPSRRPACLGAVNGMLLGRSRRMLRALVSVLFVIASSVTAAFGESTVERPAGREGDLPTVLVLVGSDFALPATVNAISGLRSTLREIDNSNRLFVENLDLHDFQGEEYELRLAEFLAEKYEHVKIDVIVVVPRRAIRFLERHGNILFPGVPQVWFGVEQGAPELERMTSQTAALTFSLPWEESLEVILDTLPDTRRLVIIEAGSVGARVDPMIDASSALARLEGRVEVELLVDRPLEEVLDRVADLSGRTAVLYYGFRRDPDGQPQSTTEVAAQVSESAEVPVFAFWKQTLGPQIMGAAAVDFETHGEEAGRLVERILAGEAPASMRPVEVTGAEVFLNDLELNRFHIPRSRLPEDFHLLNPIPTIWSTHRGWIVLTVALLLALMMVVFALLGRGRRLDSAREERELLQHELNHASRVGTMGALAGALSHELNQPLSAIMSNARAASRFLDASKPDLGEVRGALNDIVEDDRRAGEIIRRLREFLTRGEVRQEAVDLNRVVDDVLSLASAQATLLRVRIHSTLDPGLPPVTGDRIQLQQVVFNLLRNALDASADQEVRRVSLRTGSSEDGRISLSIRDYGPGLVDEHQANLFQPFFSTKEEGMGLGLSICRKIVEGHGGSISAKNHESGGAEFLLLLPGESGHEVAQAPASGRVLIETRVQ